MQPPVNYPGNQPGSAYGGAADGGAYPAPGGGVGAPYGGGFGSGMPGYPPQSAYGAPDGGAYGGGYGGALPVYPGLASMPYGRGMAEALMVPEHLAPAYGVSMVEAYKRYLKRAFTFRGYASRSEYWWACLVNMLIVMAFYFLMGVVLYIDESSGGRGGSVAGVLAMILLGCFLLFLPLNTVPQLAVFVRRMHDGGRSGWWWLLTFVPLGGLVMLIFACMESRPDLWRPEWSR